MDLYKSGEFTEIPPWYMFQSSLENSTNYCCLSTTGILSTVPRRFPGMIDERDQVLSILVVEKA